MSFMPTGTYIEKDSFIHKMNPFIKLLCTVVLLISVILSDTFAGYILVMALIALIIRFSFIGFRNALSGVRQMWLFFAIIFLMNVVFFEAKQPLWNWWIFRFSLDGVTQGINVVLRVNLAMIIGNILVSTTSPLEIIGAIESLIYPLKYIGVPIQDVAMILGVSIQFIPIFMEETDMIRKAQTARGARFESKKICEKAQSVIPLVVPIFLSAFQRADELSVAMEARGYHRKSKKVKNRKRKISTLDLIFFIGSCVLCVVESII